MQMFIIILISIIIISISIFYYFKPKNKLYLSKDIPKHTLTKEDLSFLNDNTTDSTLKNAKIGDIFYTNVKWKAKDNNYVTLKDRHYIIDRGHYYYLLKEVTLHFNKNVPIKLFNGKMDKLVFL